MKNKEELIKFLLSYKSDPNDPERHLVAYIDKNIDDIVNALENGLLEPKDVDVQKGLLDWINQGVPSDLAKKIKERKREERIEFLLSHKSDPNDPERHLVAYIDENIDDIVNALKNGLLEPEDVDVQKGLLDWINQGVPSDLKNKIQTCAMMKEAAEKSISLHQTRDEFLKHIHGRNGRNGERGPNDFPDGRG